MTIDYRKVTKLRDPNGNIVPCKFVSDSSPGCFWIKPLADCYYGGRVDTSSGIGLLFNLHDGKHRYGRRYTLIVEKEETTDMTKATFTSTETPRKPTYYKRIDGGAMFWKVGEFWHRMFNDGSCGQVPFNNSPDFKPGSFIPCYGDLVITISGG